MKTLLHQIRKCEICKDFLPNKPKPILQADVKSKIIIIGQAPGQKVQDSGIPWQDKSGDQLRLWLGVNEVQFYNEKIFALMPMGFCYPGKGKSGDLPPRPECSETWHEKLLAEMKGIELTFLIGHFAQKYYLKEKCKADLNETVRAFNEYLPKFFPLIHPSPRNRIWQKKNPWFETDVVPIIREKVKNLV